MKPKYELGQLVYFVESGIHYSKKIPCPMCFGKQFVTIILGDDTQQKIECGYCSNGLERATGQATIWEPSAIIKSGEITGINRCDGWVYSIGFNSTKESEIFISKEDAEVERMKQLEGVTERAKKYFIDNFIQAKKKQVWSAGYHKNQIKHHEKSIEWHNARLGLINESK